ncbi:MAG: metal-dependent transcriptional regulator [Chloroflexota bacterium]|nr:MAG: metal-dependent transcriptional regulator [Chloroflexota bacterium]
MSQEKTSPTVEEYLEAIHSLTGEGKPAIGARLAECLGVSAPTVTGMLSRLVRNGLVQISERKEIVLTDKGEEVARRTVRRHRLSERLLTDILGLEWHKAHEEACRFEHAISPEVEEKIANALGDPTTCPHGNPIPGSGGAVAPESIRLDRLEAGDAVVVQRISEDAERDPRLLEYLQRNGIKPGVSLVVTEVAPYNGTVTLRAGDDLIFLGLAAAAKIWVVRS